MSIYVMSDIHGMYKSFMRRINQLDNLEHVKNGDDKLILLGDYIDVGANSYKVLKTIYDLQKEIGGNMIVLKGNHDKWFADFVLMRNSVWMTGRNSFEVISGFLTEKEVYKLRRILNSSIAGMECYDNASMYVSAIMKKRHGTLMEWYDSLPLYYETEKQIFVHAGICEEAGILWKSETKERIYTERYPAVKGRFYKDIIAGHVSVSTVSGNASLHDVFWDGANHFYVDGIDSYHNIIRDEDRIIPMLVCNERDGKVEYYGLSEEGEKRYFNA